MDGLIASAFIDEVRDSHLRSSLHRSFRSQCPLWHGIIGQSITHIVFPYAVFIRRPDVPGSLPRRCGASDEDLHGQADQVVVGGPWSGLSTRNKESLRMRIQRLPRDGRAKHGDHGRSTSNLGQQPPVSPQAKRQTGRHPAGLRPHPCRHSRWTGRIQRPRLMAARESRRNGKVNPEQKVAQGSSMAARDI
jgi:hypothetical protein